MESSIIYSAFIFSIMYQYISIYIYKIQYIEYIKYIRIIVIQNSNNKEMESAYSNIAEVNKGYDRPIWA